MGRVRFPSHFTVISRAGPTGILPTSTCAKQVDVASRIGQCQTSLGLETQDRAMWATFRNGDTLLMLIELPRTAPQPRRPSLFCAACYRAQYRDISDGGGRREVLTAPHGDMSLNVFGTVLFTPNSTGAFA